jgi:hypothetical protein
VGGDQAFCQLFHLVSGRCDVSPYDARLNRVVESGHFIPPRLRIEHVGVAVFRSEAHGFEE